MNYAKHGFRIIRLHGINEKGVCTCSRGSKCTSTGKHPVYTGWEKKATTSEEVIIAEFEKHPYSNIGIATGGKFFVVDIDKDHGGYESIKPYGDMKKTVSVTTGGGGSHHYYLIPEGMKIPNGVGILEGVDIRSDGGLVVAPGSKHKNGNMYEWMPGYSPEEIEIAEPNSRLSELFVKAKENKASSKKVQEIQETIEEGSRNATMASIAGALRRKGLSHVNLQTL